MDSDFEHTSEEDMDSCSIQSQHYAPDELIELSLLRSLEIDELVEASLIDPSSRFDESLLEKIVLPFPEITITLNTGPEYPAQQLNIEYENVSLPRLVMDALRIGCRKLVEEGAKNNNFESWGRRDIGEVFDCDMTALRVTQLSDRHIHIYREQLRNGFPSTGTDSTGSEDPFQPPEDATLLKNKYISSQGADLSNITADMKASSVLSRLPEEICSLIPTQFRILHIESVLRADLYKKFLLKQSSMFEDLKTRPLAALRKCIPPKQRSSRETLESMANYLVTPKMTFHGTSNQFVPSIVRHGFLAPGARHPESHDPLPVRCGSTYGQGIYSSPSPSFSLSYSGTSAQPTSPTGFWGLKLFVCATIMGRSSQMTREDDWWYKTQPMEGADSHVGNNQMEYIVFDNSQILPCYVIHLDWGVENLKFFQDIDVDKSNFNPLSVKLQQKLSGDVVAPGDRQRMKEALIAKASKYFPYGYGPKSGTAFVIEEVAEVDEDEEEYGDYQKMRVQEMEEGEEGAVGFWEWDDSEEKVKAARFDEYTEFRSGWGKSGTGM